MSAECSVVSRVPCAALDVPGTACDGQFGLLIPRLAPSPPAPSASGTHLCVCLYLALSFRCPRKVKSEGACCVQPVLLSAVPLGPATLSRAVRFGPSFWPRTLPVQTLLAGAFSPLKRQITGFSARALLLPGPLPRLAGWRLHCCVWMPFSSFLVRFVDFGFVGTMCFFYEGWPEVPSPVTVVVTVTVAGQPPCTGLCMCQSILS